ncbi:hypothetical protein [Candidatus Nitrosocosmicus sp. T]
MLSNNLISVIIGIIALLLTSYIHDLVNETNSINGSVCNYNNSNADSVYPRLTVKLNDTFDEVDNDQPVKNMTQVELLFNEKSVILDLGCDNTIWSIELYWNLADTIQYNYTIKIATSNNITTKIISSTTNDTLGNILPSIGTGNSIGRYVEITINEPRNMSFDNLQLVSVIFYHPIVIEKKTDIESWNTFDNDYPDSISISNFTHSVNLESIYEIKSGDSDIVLNPNFVLSKEPVLDIGLGNVISFGINYSHIEGARSKIEVKDDIGNMREVPIFDLKQLSYNDFRNSTPGLKTFYFLPYLAYSDNPIDTRSPDLYYENRSLSFINKTLSEGLPANLTISFAPDSETIVYYKTKVSVSN